METIYRLENRELLIRPIRKGDLEEIRNIYNHSVEMSIFTMDLEPRTPAEMVTWYESHYGRFPAFVGVVNRQIIGFGSLSKWAERKGYYPSCEASIYLSPVDIAQGFGDAFMVKLSKTAKENDFTTIISFMTSTNKLAKNLVKRHGYTYIGLMRRVAIKFGTMVDIAIYQLMLELNETCNEDIAIHE